MRAQKDALRIAQIGAAEDKFGEGFTFCFFRLTVKLDLGLLAVERDRQGVLSDATILAESIGTDGSYRSREVHIFNARSHEDVISDGSKMLAADLQLREVAAVGKEASGQTDHIIADNDLFHPRVNIAAVGPDRLGALYVQRGNDAHIVISIQIVIRGDFNVMIAAIPVESADNTVAVSVHIGGSVLCNAQQYIRRARIGATADVGAVDIVDNLFGADFCIVDQISLTVMVPDTVVDVHGCTDTLERIVANGRNSGRNAHLTGEAGAFKGRVADRSDALREADARQIHSTLEGVRANAGNAVRNAHSGDLAHMFTPRRGVFSGVIFHCTSAGQGQNAAGVGPGDAILGTLTAIRKVFDTVAVRLSIREQIGDIIARIYLDQDLVLILICERAVVTDNRRILQGNLRRRSARIMIFAEGITADRLNRGRDCQLIDAAAHQEIVVDLCNGRIAIPYKGSHLVKTGESSTTERDYAALDDDFRCDILVSLPIGGDVFILSGACPISVAVPAIPGTIELAELALVNIIVRCLFRRQRPDGRRIGFGVGAVFREFDHTAATDKTGFCGSALSAWRSRFGRARAVSRKGGRGQKGKSHAEAQQE